MIRRNNESYKEWCVRKLIELVDELDGEERSAVDYIIGYLIGIGWADDEEIY